MKTTMKSNNKSTAGGGSTSSSGSSILNYFSKSSTKKNKFTTPTHLLLQKNQDGAPSSSSVNNDNGIPIKVKTNTKSTTEIGSNTYNNMADRAHKKKLDNVGTPESSSTPETHEPTTPPSPSSNSSSNCDDNVILNHDDAIDLNERIIIKSSSTESEARSQSSTEETPPTNETELTTPPSPPTPDTWINSVTAQPSIKEDAVANDGKKRQHSACRVGNQGGSSNSVEQTPMCLLEESTQDVSSQQKQEDETAEMNTDTPLSTTCTPSILLASSSVSKSSTNNFFRKYTASSKKKSSSTKNNNKQQQITTNIKPIKRQKQSSNQLFLDFGQNSFGKQTVCNICGMLRVHGLDEDSQQHDKICKDYKEGVSCMGWKNERSVVTFGKHDRILEVRPDDAQQHKRKVVEVKRIVDIELGFASSSSSNRIDEDENDSSDDANMTSYMYISKKRVVGLLMVKRIQRAYELLPPNKEEEKSKGNSSISRSLKPSKALLGVHQIWVHKSHRQRGIASKLVTAARDHLIFGMMIPLELIAFSSPTDEGLVFAKGYTASNTPLIYDIH